MMRRLATISFNCPPSAQKRAGKRGRPLVRGFTLLEMMVVVVIITLLASIALPGISRQMQNHRTKQAAESISAIYRGARLRSLGRGSAVLVRYTGSTGMFTVMEAIQGTAVASAECAQLPAASCLNPAGRWAGGDAQTLKSTGFGAGYELGIVATVMTVVVPGDPASPATASDVDICYAPSGKSYIRTVPTSALSSMTTPMTFTLSRTDGVGFQRAVVVTPGGNARAVAP